MAVSEKRDRYEVTPIAKIQTGFSSKFGIPRQSGIVSEICGKIIFEKQYSGPDWTRGLEGFSHIWVLWMFSDNLDANIGATVRPPKLGGNTRMGVFATRSPFRPNFIGMSVLKLEKIERTAEGTVLYVKGADMVDGTPIIDIKPYLAITDKIDNATAGFTADVLAEKDRTVQRVDIPEDCLNVFPGEHIEELKGILLQDPRPGYISDGNREYSFEFYGYNIRFTVSCGTLFVRKISDSTE